MLGNTRRFACVQWEIVEALTSLGHAVGAFVFLKSENRSSSHSEHGVLIFCQEEKNYTQRLTDNF